MEKTLETLEPKELLQVLNVKRKMLLKSIVKVDAMRQDVKRMYGLKHGRKAK